jgi:LmbE family N-acetylglucosaminyl deacetylase
MSLPATSVDPVMGTIARLGPALAVVAHPDDESFGLGSLLAALVGCGTEVRVLCLTQGESSTLGEESGLAARRAGELACACARLGVGTIALRDFPDGRLGVIPAAVLDRVVDDAVGDAATLIVFEPSGVTGHSDHRAATAAALRAGGRHGLPVVQWGVSPEVAARLNREFGTSFGPFEDDDVVEVIVDRTAQMAAVACHSSQLGDNPVVARRLALEGNVQHIRVCLPGNVHGTP